MNFFLLKIIDPCNYFCRFFIELLLCFMLKSLGYWVYGVIGIIWNYTVERVQFFLSTCDLFSLMKIFSMSPHYFLMKLLGLQGLQLLIETIAFTSIQPRINWHEWVVISSAIIEVSFVDLYSLPQCWALCFSRSIFYGFLFSLDHLFFVSMQKC